MWNHADNGSTAGYTAKETSGWICSWITQDRCRTSGHRNTSPMPKRAVCLSKHTLMIKSGVSWRKRLITVDIITQVETLSTHNWIKVLNLQQLLFCLSAHCPEQLFSPLHTHSLNLFCSWAPEHLCWGRKDRFLHLKSFCAEADPAPLSTPAALPKAHGREWGRFGTSRFSILSLGLCWAQNNHSKPSQNHWVLPRSYSLASLKLFKTTSLVRFGCQFINQPRFIWKKNSESVDKSVDLNRTSDKHSFYFEFPNKSSNWRNLMELLFSLRTSCIAQASCRSLCPFLCFWSIFRGCMLHNNPPGYNLTDFHRNFMYWDILA